MRIAIGGLALGLALPVWAAAAVTAIGLTAGAPAIPLPPPKPVLCGWLDGTADQACAPWGGYQFVADDVRCNEDPNSCFYYDPALDGPLPGGQTP